MLPFIVVVSVNEISLSDEKDGWLATLQSGFIYARPCPFVRALDVIASFDYIGTEIFLIGNARVHGYYHAELPAEIPYFRVSVDFLRATKGYSVESWLQSLGFNDDGLDLHQDWNEKSQGGYALPYAYISPFSLNLVLNGLVALNSNRTKSIRVDEFFGTARTTSNNLIMYFVTVVLARAPGLLQDIKFLGMDMTDVAGAGSGMTLGASLIPVGQYIALAVLAGVDIVNGAIAFGKESRGRPDDRYRTGDLSRGIAYFMEEVTRKGAMRRGKSFDDFYDEEDRVKVDPVDFAIGAAEETGKYLDSNKGRFLGVAVGCVATVALSIIITPWAGIGVGLLAGQGTTLLFNATERKIRNMHRRNGLVDETSPKRNLKRPFFSTRQGTFQVRQG